MRKYLIILAGVLGFVYLLTPVDSMSVQEKISDDGKTYYWEQWCWYEYRGGFTRKLKKGTFSVESSGGFHGQLSTDLCSSLKGFF